ncbi:hypothetical protein P872_16760 [Rhodonellum psychrophilum GCM71 = DSM 17998]|uniref:DUF3575 domain-containing protein n=2 Tax=Rhodonellum TaxID=336827 RepID=U5BZ91_9BACT|nr:MULTISPECIES: hypothetical protein [Rhodonellum]ERM83173.1 hypothetical protein P872_16760 [Rhodonellum psychrophilum GCM71 = DSM 17998]SDZ14911.1 hypothetical protein SAMN05444412_106210 [Rhodonellum ikkaensis]
MKKSIFGFLAIFLISFSIYAQTDMQPAVKMEKDHSTGEIKLNFLNTIILGSIELGYEQFLSREQSIGVELHLNDRFGYNSQKGNRDFDASSVLVSYNFYFDGNQDAKLYLFPFFKYRFGEFTEAIDGITTVTNLNSGYLGLGAGYKWVFNDKFAFGPYANIARGFSSEVNDRFSAVEFKAGFSVGFRF